MIILVSDNVSQFYPSNFGLMCFAGDTRHVITRPHYPHAGRPSRDFRAALVAYRRQEVSLYCGSDSECGDQPMETRWTDLTSVL